MSSGAQCRKHGQSAFERESAQRDAVRVRTIPEDRADQVIGDGQHEHLAFNHLRGECA
jgi:hypothetical protein